MKPRQPLRRRLLCGLMGSALGMPALVRAAPAYPQRPVTLVSPFPAGGATDLVARVLGQKLARALGQPFVVDNRAGATGLIGETAVLRARPDGHTLLIASNSSHVIAPLLQARRPFHPSQDFAPITQLGRYPLALTVAADSPLRTLADLLEQARKAPGVLNVGSVGQGSVTHLAGEQFALQAGIRLTHVPYKGTAALTTALLGGEIQLRFDSVGSTRPLVEGGRVRVLAVTGPQRSPLLPQVPTLGEAGVPGVDAQVWVGALAPRDTPQAIVELLGARMRGLLQTDADVARVLADNGMQALGPQGADFSRAIDQESAQWSDLLRRIGLSAT
ncbi:MAG: tripartite tricarboxylate transporter substrate binding protein [Burkholderiaceae bacterium]|jgi:tripartite-type tricarboxylate transporter receptor subunit TctC|nr:tripartite tricarboxylate transporter substrate binding protein [Burkholderiaceae bacterium]